MVLAQAGLPEEQQRKLNLQFIQKVAEFNMAMERMSKKELNQVRYFLKIFGFFGPVAVAAVIRKQPEIVAEKTKWEDCNLNPSGGIGGRGIILRPVTWSNSSIKRQALSRSR